MIVCFLPDRKDATRSSASSQTSSPSSELSTSPHSARSKSAESIGNSGKESTPTDAIGLTATAPSTGDLLARGRKPLPRASPQTFETVEPPADAEQAPLSEEMIYSMKMTLPCRRRLTLLPGSLNPDSINRKIKTENNARALETNAMMLAEFGSSSS